MNSLLKADFYTLIKSKMTYILLFICAVFPLFTIAAFLLVKLILKTELIDEESVNMIMGMFTGRAMMFGNFSLSNNAGLVIPIFAGIFTMSDIRHGTIRNKVIIGKSKTQIYLSHLIVSITLCVCATLLSFVILALGSVLFFKYGFEFDSKELLNFLRCLIIGILTFVYVASISTFFALVTKSLPLTIILTIAVSLGLGIFNTISIMVDIEKFKYIFYMIPTFANTTLTQAGTLTVEEFLFGLGSYIVFISLNTILGIILFKKTDLK